MKYFFIDYIFIRLTFSTIYVVGKVEDAPVFGVPLALAVERSRCHDGIKLPVVVRECIDYIEENGLKVEGIYRLDSWVV